MFDKSEENLQQNSDHQLIDVHQQVNQVIFLSLPKTKIIQNTDTKLRMGRRVSR